MSSKRNEKQTIKSKRGDDMAVLAKPINRITAIRKDDARRFTDEFNKNKVTKEFLTSCKKAGDLFEKNKKR